ncbi:glycoside hydrolase family 66 protein [Mucisphaera calidilacus]|nr:glycoside hydrolase family 66 protein [Mucisphaera calidilacus]
MTLEGSAARYDPGDPINLRLDTPAQVTNATAEVTYRYLGDVVATQQFEVNGSEATWQWLAPDDDFRGYTAEVRLYEQQTLIDSGSIAIDVSSDWAKFPRYGFLSDYSFLSASQMDAVIDDLNRHHINGLQFYDWHSTHHRPLEGSVQNPAFSWRDIANRRNYRTTVEGYIERARDRNMVTMAYNLLYGVNEAAGAAQDGVSPDWFLYRDSQQGSKDIHTLPAGWKSDVSLVDPYNAGWREHIAQETARAAEAYGFDGWHVDQLGDRGQVYAANGRPVDLEPATGAFVSAMASHPDLVGQRFVANAVNQYGQAALAIAPVDFLYTEVWNPNEHYNDLAGVLMDNHELSGGQLNSVLAAYMNYDHADQPGAFNTPAVLMTDAVIFAFGGAHIELGEHMLGKEYFPNNTLAQDATLRQATRAYYDFLVGYQNLLRNGGTFHTHRLTSPTHPMSDWPAQQGRVAALSKTVGEHEVFHLINFLDAAHMNWRDTNATQPQPLRRDDIVLETHTQRRLNKAWFATPDDSNGLPSDVAFLQSPNGFVRFTVPSLEIWTMVVAEGDAPRGHDQANDPAYDHGWTDGSDGGHGFGPWSLRATSTAGGFAGFFRPDDAQDSRGLDNTGSDHASTGVTLASFANKGSGIEQATALRTLDETLDSAGDTFRVTFEHGTITGQVGFTLREVSTAEVPSDYAIGSRFQLLALAGSANYQILDADGIFDTGVPLTDLGITAQVRLIDLHTYDLTLWRYETPRDFDPVAHTFTGRSLALSDPIVGFALFQHDAAGGLIQDDVFWNHISYTLGEASPNDLNADGVVDLDDLDYLVGHQFDYNGDGYDASDVSDFASEVLGLRIGDVNADGNIDLLDLSLLASHFDLPGTLWSQGNLNGDAAGTDLLDLSLLASNFGSSAILPEPTSVLAMGLVILARSRRSRASASNPGEKRIIPDGQRHARSSCFHN